jgi:Flp pilus assembly pilin Flp
MEKIKRFLKEEEGLEMSEYALMGALICVAAVTAIGLLSGAINGAFGRITSAIAPAAAGGGG